MSVNLTCSTLLSVSVPSAPAPAVTVLAIGPFDHGVVEESAGVTGGIAACRADNRILACTPGDEATAG